jgi:uncharacterized protein YcgL (UPF0745 family)
MPAHVFTLPLRRKHKKRITRLKSSDEKEVKTVLEQRSFFLQKTGKVFTAQKHFHSLFRFN